MEVSYQSLSWLIHSHLFSFDCSDFEKNITSSSSIIILTLTQFLLLEMRSPSLLRTWMDWLVYINWETHRNIVMVITMMIKEQTCNYNNCTQYWASDSSGKLQETPGIHLPLEAATVTRYRNSIHSVPQHPWLDHKSSGLDRTDRLLNWSPPEIV